ncbi:rhomboid-related protein 4-like [Rhodnius prolixus]|uniref:Putative rhomboid domain-containing protein 1 panstrongylus lignarius n=1 Tax=Rhodnius prolixus TaxID=13249 RepID=A0A4P6DGA4_RHOPR
MRRGDRRPRHLEMGVLLLISEILSIGYDVIPPITLCTIIGQTLLYVEAFEVPWSKHDVCISAKKVWYDKNYKTLLLSTFEHADDMHLYYNMISFLLKGRTLEPLYGSANFALLLSILCLMTSSIYVSLGVLLSNVLNDSSLLYSCAIGFSGVIFALKIITTDNSSGSSVIMGIRVPTKYAAWAELIAIHILVPNASFLGHLAGIIAGVLYVKTPLKRIIDGVCTTITGVPIYLHSYRNNYYYSGYR